MKHPVRSITAALAVIGALTLVGCTATPTPAPSTSAPASEAPPAVLIPTGTAQENLPFFDQVNRATVAGNPEAQGKQLIDGLIAAGFERSAMQVGSDTTTLGRPVDAVEFSVHWGKECLIGQFGPTIDGYFSTVQPALSTGSCLIGSTRAIDW